MKQKKRYDENCFYTQLKKARNYRGHKTQVSLCTIIGVSKQVYSFWELGKRKPSYHQLIILSGVLGLRISYFFIADAEPGDYDLADDNTDHPTAESAAPNTSTARKVSNNRALN